MILAEKKLQKILSLHLPLTIQYLSYGRYAAVSTDNDIIWYFGGHGCNGPSTTAMGGLDGSCVSEE